VNDDGHRRRREAVERDLELIDAVEVQAVGRHHDRSHREVLDRRVDAADRATQRARTAIADRARDLEVDHARLILAAEHDRATANLEVTRREQRERDLDLVERERLEHAALAADLRLGRRLVAAGQPKISERAHRDAAERGERRRVGVERPRDQIVTAAEDRHLPLHLESLVLVLDVEERALEPVEAVLERAVVEAAFLDRHAQLLVERTYAEHRQVELDLERRVDAPGQAIEKPQLLLTLGSRRGRGRGMGALAAERSLDREPQLRERDVRRDQLEVGVGRAHEQHAARQLCTLDVDVEAARVVA